jgi:cytochrome c553
MKRTLIILAVLIALFGAGAFALAWSGIYNVAASTGHLAITRWFLEFGMRNSVETHALGIEVPPLDDPSLFYRGLGHYQGGCAPCHGAPGEGRNPITRQMLPPPPYLANTIEHWSAAELFWIVKHGIKYAGMPAWVAQQRDDEVWAVVAFLQRLPEMGPEEYRRLSESKATSRVEGTSEERARLLAVAGSAGESLVACARCHGLRGAGGGEGGFPRLAGQSFEYLQHALESYAVGSRPSGIMQPVAAELSEAERRNIADYYAGIEDAPYPPKPQAADRQILQQGAALVANGAPEQGVPACVTCHGPSAAVAPDPVYPSLAGQYADYIALQLELWRSGKRGGGSYSEIMATIAEQLTDEQIRAVSLYYASLRPGEAPQAAAESPGENLDAPSVVPDDRN